MDDTSMQYILYSCNIHLKELL